MKTSLLIATVAILSVGCASTKPITQATVKGEFVKDGVTNKIEIIQPKDARWKHLEASIIDGKLIIDDYSSAANAEALAATVEIGKQQAATTQHAVDTLGDLAARAGQTQGIPMGSKSKAP